MKNLIYHSIIAFIVIHLIINHQSDGFSQKIIKSEFQQSLAFDTIMCNSHFTKTYIGNKKNALDYIYTQIPRLKEQGFEIESISEIESPGGFHLAYNQIYESTPIFHAHIKINMDKNGYVLSMFDNTYYGKIERNSFPNDYVVKKFISSLGENVRHKIKKVYFPQKNKLLPVIHLEISILDEYYEVIINHNSEILYKRDLNNYSSPTDTLAKASIFLPDPLTTAQAIYGTTYNDADDNDLPALLTEIKEAIIPVKFEVDTFKLESPFVKVVDISSPTIAPITSTTDSFIFTRSQSGFEDINAYYHINTFQNYIQSLGFKNMANYQLWIDTHGNSGNDQSTFSAFDNPPRIVFGEGGVDDAEDADVIIHEYIHAISQSAAPNTNLGSQRNALDEGIGDYFAASYSRSINPHNWERVYSWDGHNEFWTGRFVISTKTYPVDLSNNLYEDADIWSSTIMQLWNDLGALETDKLMLQTIYGFAKNISMSDAAHLFIQADSSLNNGKNFNILCTHFASRGFLPNCYPTAIRETENATEILITYSNNTIRIESKTNIVDCSVYDFIGRLVLSSSELKNTKVVTLNSLGIANGIYIVKVQSLDNLITKKKSFYNFKLYKNE